MQSTKQRKNQSPIRTIPQIELQKIIDESCTIAQILMKIGMSIGNNNFLLLKKRIKDDNLSMEIFYSNERTRHPTRLTNEIIFVNNSLTARMQIKRRILEENLLPYICDICNNPGEHNGIKLSLQLDHINGINNDHRLENLRFLCPNCHSQTPTFGKGISKGRKAYVYESLEHRNNRIDLLKKFTVEKEELEKLILSFSFQEIGKKFNVSGNTIKKKCKRYDIDLTKSKYFKYGNGKRKIN